MIRTFAAKSALNEAVALINAGQIDKAEAICHSGIARNSDDVNMVALKRELNRKEKALAEAAALLVLQKKYQALWVEEDA